MDMDTSFANTVLNTDQSQSPVKQDYIWTAFAPNHTSLTTLDVRSDPSLSTSLTSSPRPFSNQISPSGAGGQLPFQTAAANPTFLPRFVVGGQSSLTTGGRPLTTSRSHTSLSTEFTQPTIPRPRSLDFDRPDVRTPYSGIDHPLTGPTGGTYQAPPPEQRAGLKRRWSPSLESTHENRLETLWNAHGVEGSGHLGILSADIPHDPHLFTGDTIAGGIPFDLWGGNTSPNSVFVFGQQGDANGLAGFAAPQFGITIGSNGTPEDRIEVDYPPFGLGADLTTPDPPLTRYTTKQPEVSPLGMEAFHSFGSRRSSSIEAVTTNGSKKMANKDTSPDLEHHEHDEGDAADGDDDLEDHHVKADPEKPNKSANNNFVNKLHTMISDPKAASFIWWTELGTSFIVSSAGEFSREVLGQHFKHSNFSSFVRQLNMYGFHKINRTPRNQRPQADAQRWEFSHPKFLRGRTDLLEDIKRKAIEPDPNQTRQRVELPTEVAAQLRRMSQEHKEVVEALLTERRRVQKLVGVVKNLYDTIAHITGGGNLTRVPAFPMDLLDSPSSTGSSSPLMDDMLASLNHTNSHPMKLAGNTLVPASASSSPTTPTCSPDRIRRCNAVAVEQQKVDSDGHAQKRARLGVELAAPGEALVRRPSGRSQTQPEGGGVSPPGGSVHSKRRGHTMLHGHAAHHSSAAATAAALRYTG